MLPVVVDSFADAVSDVPDGATVMIGGFGGSGGQPTRLMLALADHGPHELTIIGNVAGISKTTGYGWPPHLEPIDQGIFFELGLANRIICSFRYRVRRVRCARSRRHGVKAGGGERDTARYVGGAYPSRRSRNCCVFTPTGVGTPVQEDKEVREFNGRPHLLEHALRADFALIRAKRADTYGNLEYVGTSRAFNPVMAPAADVTIAEVDEVVEPGEIDPERVGTPGVYVNRIVRREAGDPLP